MTPQELKNSILQWAIQGKLVEQRGEEGTAKALIEQIKVEKEQLIKDKKIKKEKTLPEITEEEIPFDIPESWEWVRLNDIVSILGDGIHGTPEYDESGDYYFINGNNLNNGSIEVKDNTKKVNVEQYNKYKKHLGRNTILVSINGTIGNIAFYNDENIILGKSACYFNLMLNEFKEYMYWLINTRYFVKYATTNATGSTIKNVSLKTMKSFIIPLPPLEEQKRIVAKIEELMAYVEQYDKAYNKLEVFNKKFPEDMQKSILQYAIQGKLVEQRTEEGTAEELYQQIQEEKARLIKEGKIKKDKPLAEITEDEIPFDIPESWKWVKLGDISTYGQTKTKISAKNILPEMWSLDLEDIEKGSGRIIERKRASDRKITGDKVCFKKGDILYSKLRPYLLKILTVDDDGICTPELVPFTTYGNVDSRYLMWVLKAPHIDFIINTVTYGVKMPRVGTDTMLNLLIPLPPLEEQKRIVAKIEEMLPYCQQLIK